MNKNTKILPLFIEDLLPRDRHALHESTRKTFPRHEIPIELLNSAPGGLLLEKWLPE